MLITTPIRSLFSRFQRGFNIVTPLVDIYDDFFLFIFLPVKSLCLTLYSLMSAINVFPPIFLFGVCSLFPDDYVIFLKLNLI